MVKQSTLYLALAGMGGAVLLSEWAGTAVPGSDYVVDAPGYVIIMIIALMLVGVV